MNDLKFIKITKEYQRDILAMLEEVKVVDNNEPWQYAGMASLEKFSSFADWLEKESIGENLLPNRVPVSTFILVRNSDNKVLGVYNIRHALNDYLFNFGGHIGYSIRSSERKRIMELLALNWLY